MISRLKRQTKKRHSVKRAWFYDFPGYGRLRVPGPVRRVTLTLQPFEPIIGAPFTPDVWAP